MIIKGQKISDRYEIIKNIGEGGMANVYLAIDTILNRKVAVKVLRGDLANDEKFVRKFQREASAASNLDHPNIVGIYDVGEDNGIYYIVMEYIEGQTLKSLIKRRGSLTLLEVIDIMTQLTNGIAHAHANGIIHRDIKPQNVLILDDGLVKIADFGIAQALNSNELTQTNSVMGSVHYLPPEQANGTGSTFQSDIYSLGILMYELIIGKVPFKGDNAVEIAIKHMKDPIPNVRDIKEDIPQAVENIILKATAKNPRNRYATAEEMSYDLKTCLDEDKKDVPRIVFDYPEFEKDEESKVLTSRERKNKDKANIDQTPEEDIVEDKKQNKKIIILAAVLLALIAIIVGIIFVATNGKGTKTVEVPDVSNMSEEDATKKLEKLGLEVKIEERNDDEIEDGNVIKTSPRAGKSIKTDSTIIIYVSKGSEGYEIINYVGKDIDMVEKELTSKGIVVMRDEEEHTKDEANIKENVILSQDVEEGTKLVAGDKITLTIPKFISTYPDFVNEVYTLDEVKKWCKENNITLVTKEKESTTDKDGTIIYQSRAAGSKVVSGVTLTVTISKTPTVSKEPETTVQPKTDTTTTTTQNTNTTTTE